MTPAALSALQDRSVAHFSSGTTSSCERQSMQQPPSWTSMRAKRSQPRHTPSTSTRLARRSQSIWATTWVRPSGRCTRENPISCETKVELGRSFGGCVMAPRRATPNVRPHEVCASLEQQTIAARAEELRLPRSPRLRGRNVCALRRLCASRGTACADVGRIMSCLKPGVWSPKPLMKRAKLESE